MRGNRNFLDDDMNMKVIKYSCIGIGILAIIVLGLLFYSKSLNEEVKQGTLKQEQFADLMNKTNTNSNNSTTSASTEIGKTINEVSNETTSNNINLEANTNNINNTINTTGNTVNNKTENKTSTVNSNTTNNINNIAENKAETTAEKKVEEKKELAFLKPVEGDIVKEYAQENLIYSNTLEEWTTHTGIDIKADKTTVVKSAEAGMVKTIKNDPRYGLTIVIEHEQGYQTVYSNLLTSEFVVEGEKVEKGQSLGTVGNTAAFEIADEPHLHFEILKDSVSIDPSIYLK